MYSGIVFTPAFLAALAVAAPAPQVPGYTGASQITPLSSAASGQTLASSFGPDSQVPAIFPTPGLQPPRVSSDLTGPTSHGPFSGTPTTTGAAKAPATLAASIGTLPPNPTATYYNSVGVPLNPMPAPYTPAGMYTVFTFGTSLADRYQVVWAQTAPYPVIWWRVISILSPLPSVCTRSGSSSISSSTVSLHSARMISLPQASLPRIVH